jgi:DNA polymerase-3 subunit alpha
MPLDDSADLRDAVRRATVGVFQLESQGMRDALLVDMRPTASRTSSPGRALSPGPDGEHPDLQRRKHGEESPTTCTRRSKPILKPTYGVIVYQEQVMQIAQVLSGYSLGEADMLRRAMGKKIKAEMDAAACALRRGALSATASARPGRRRSSTAAGQVRRLRLQQVARGAYALVAYQTAYLKANYPVEFLAASMSLDMGNTDKLAVFFQEAPSARRGSDGASLSKLDNELDQRRLLPVRSPARRSADRCHAQAHHARR